MLQIIFILFGLYILIKGRVNFSKNRELARPNSTYIGVVFLLSALLLFIYFDSVLDIIIGTIFFIVIFTVSYVLSQNATDENIIKDKNSSRLMTLWLVLFFPSLFAAPLVVFLFDDPASGKDLIVYIVALNLLTTPLSLLIGAIAGYLNRKKNKDYILVYLPFLNICLFLVPLIIASILYIVTKFI